MTRELVKLLAGAVVALAGADAAATATATAETKAGAKRPNFVIIVADDMGYGDASCYGNEEYETPHLDALAAEGVRFTDFYANSSVCSPTRAALMTGRYQQRAGIDGVITAANHRDWGLHTAEVTFAKLLQDAGYATGIFGKWHLGYERRFSPIHHGFDQFRGYVAGNVDYFSHIDQTGVFDWWHDDRQVREQGYVTHLITDHGLRFIDEHHDRPFLLYLPHQAPHYPYQGPDERADRQVGGQFDVHGSRQDRRVAYAEMMQALDQGIGQIIESLREHGIEDRTFVLFFSDNGANRYGCNGPLRGYKGSLFEGGIRVPAVAWWPGTIEPGQVSAQVIIGMDVMPTLLELAGVPLPVGHKLDAVSMVPALRGEAMDQRPLFWHFQGRRAMRDGPWKMVADPRGNGQPQLFHLGQDLAERENLAEQHPARLDRMVQRYQRWYEDVTTGATPQPPPGE